MVTKLRDLLADVLFPTANACHLCGAFPQREALLCDRCLGALETLRYKKLHVAAQEAHPPLHVCMAAYPHRQEARDLIHLLKYESDAIVAGLLAEGMVSAMAICPQRPDTLDAVAPVPLHSARLMQRGYNQALLLAQQVCRHTGLALADGALIRVHSTDTQLHRDRAERLMAMRHAFAVADAKAVRGKHLLLVDDVLTTGATAMSCAAALTEAGAASVSLLTVCRA